MIIPPTTTYLGTTIVLPRPSRFDKEHATLLYGMAGQWFEEECIAPLKLNACELRTEDEDTQLLPKTSHVILAGTNNPRVQVGYPDIYKGIKAINVYFPQDCCDHKRIEGEDDDEEETFAERDTKDSYPTKRSNHRFWTKWHCLKFYKKIRQYPRILPFFYPSYENLKTVLRSIRGENLYLDIETSRNHRGISCIGFSSDSLFPKVFVVPIYGYNNQLCYPAYADVWCDIAMALATNTAVIHNSKFDLLILHAFYKFPLPPQVYDTMVANHRLFPEAEKSLAHVIAQWTWQEYHKNVSTETYNEQQQTAMWLYNAKDVYNLKLIRDAQMEYCANPWAEFHPSSRGLLDSINQGNDSILPYLDTELTGLRLNQQLLAVTEVTLKSAARQYERIARILKGDPDFNPGSSQQCAKFFHDKLNYPVVKRSEVGAPSLGRKQLYQLQLKHNNPLIPVILKYRKVAKDVAMLESELFTLP